MRGKREERIRVNRCCEFDPNKFVPMFLPSSGRREVRSFVIEHDRGETKVTRTRERDKGREEDYSPLAKVR